MNTFRRYILQAALLAAAVLFLFPPAHPLLSAERNNDGQKNGPGSEESARDWKNISAAEAALMIEENKNNPDLVILDVRTPREYSDGHIEGALNIDVMSESFNGLAGKLDTGKTYLIHCRSGKRSAKAAALMKVLGFRDIYHIEGGIIAWEKQGLPVKK